MLKLIAEGHTSKEIAELLVISVKTVDRHRTNMLDKRGMRDRVELTRGVQILDQVRREGC